MTIQVAANNIRYLCNADTNLVKTRKLLFMTLFIVALQLQLIMIIVR